jgi:hypothetical protein
MPGPASGGHDAGRADLPQDPVMYSYRGRFTPRLIDLMDASPQFLPYLDIPLQHGHRETLLRIAPSANWTGVTAPGGDARQDARHRTSARRSSLVSGRDRGRFRGPAQIVRDWNSTGWGPSPTRSRQDAQAGQPYHVPAEVMADARAPDAAPSGDFPGSQPGPCWPHARRAERRPGHAKTKTAPLDEVITWGAVTRRPRDRWLRFVAASCVGLIVPVRNDGARCLRPDG